MGRLEIPSSFFTTTTAPLSISLHFYALKVVPDAKVSICSSCSASNNGMRLETAKYAARFAGCPRSPLALEVADDMRVDIQACELSVGGRRAMAISLTYLVLL
jgi:hypothetical protein